METQYTDAIVIGGGPNGLAAAITLAEAGRSVTMLEARHKLGGAVATDELTLPGFKHDTFSAVYPAAAASPVFGRMPLADHGLHWVHPPIAMAHPLGEDRAAALYRSVDQTAANLNRWGAGDGDRWRAFVSPYLRHWKAVRQTLLSGFPPIKGALRLLLALKPEGTLDFARLLLMPASALAGELFRGAGGPPWLYGAAMHGDVPPASAGSAMTAAYLNIMGHAVGWPSPRGGAGELANALVSYFSSLGGTYHTDCTVERVLVERGRTAGVVVHGGGVFRAPIVVADVTPHWLLRLAGDDLPASYISKMARFRYGPATLKVDWALSAPIPWSAPEVRQAGTVHIGGPAHAMLRAIAQAERGELPEQPFLLLGQQSLADPTRAPAGQHTAWAYTHTPSNIDWDQECDRHVERIEAQIERFAPGFRDRVLARHIITPPSFEQRNRNLVQGDVGGGSYTLDQLIFRPIPAISPYRTPVRGLYIGSSSTFPGGAVHGVPGHAAARQALLESRVRCW